MVFYGASKGCLTCLKRRVKCDEGKPTCSRCSKAKRQCQGYRDQVSVIFRDETHKFINIAGPKSDLDSTLENVRTVLQWMLISGQQEMPMADLYGIIPVIYRQAQENSVFKVIFSILCDFLVTRARNGRAPAVASIARYGQILGVVRAQLRDAERIENINEVLLTILSINSIEGLSATETSLALWGAHYDIIHSLLRNESREFPMDEASILIFFAFREMVVMNHVLKSKSMSHFLDTHYHIFHDCVFCQNIKSNPSIELASLGISVANLRASTQSALLDDRSPQNLLSMRSLIQQCKELDTRLTFWHNNLPLISKACSIPAADLHRISSAPHLLGPNLREAYLYRNLHTAELHCRYYTLRAMVLSVILRCNASLNQSDLWLSLNASQDHASTSETQNSLLDVFQSIYSSAPFFLGITPPSLPPNPTIYQISPLGPIQLVNPLYVARSVFFAPLEQRVWIDTTLRLIRHNFDVEIPGMIAASNDFRPLFPKEGEWDRSKIYGTTRDWFTG